MGRKTTIGILLVIVAAHVILAIGFATSTPWRTPGVIMGAPAVDIGAPDERQHMNYVLQLAHGGLPVFDPHDPNHIETIEFHQPPLFYGIARGWAALTGASLPPVPPDNGGEEMSRDDGLKMRALNILVGTATITGVFFLALWAYRREEIALAAAAFAALLPMHVAMSGAFSNDPLLFCLCTWTLALTVHGVRDGWTTRIALGVGILTGLSILTKTNGLALLPVLLLAVMMKGEHGRPSAKQFAAAIVPILLLVTPWFIRNQRLYGDPAAMGVFTAAFGGTAQASTFINAQGPAFYWIDMVGAFVLRSFVGTFGYMDIWLTNTTFRGGASGLYYIVWLLIGAGFIGWIMAMREESADARKGHWLNGIYTLIVVLLFLKFNMQYFQAQARYLLPAIGPISLGVGAGLTYLLKSRKFLALGLIVLILGSANIFALSKLPAAFELRSHVRTQ